MNYGVKVGRTSERGMPCFLALSRSLGNAGYFLYKEPLFGCSTIIPDSKLFTNVKKQICIFAFLLLVHGKVTPGLFVQNTDLIACTQMSIYTSASFKNLESSVQAPLSASIYLLAPPYAEKGGMMVCESGLMNPDTQYNFNPKGNVTRADAAVVFMRLSKALAGEPLTGMLIPGTVIDFSKISLSRKETDAQALAVAKQIASVIPTDRSDIGRIMIAAHIVSSYSKFCTYTMSGPDHWSAYGVFVKSEYSCAGSTRALWLVLTCMGYQWRHIDIVR